MQYIKYNFLFTYVCIFPAQCPICEGNSMFRFYYKKKSIRLNLKCEKFKRKGLRTLHNLTNITILSPTATLQKTVET